MKLDLCLYWWCSPHFFFSLLLNPFLGGPAHGDDTAPRRASTYCNPVDLPYRFQLEGVSRREAADPTMMVFHGEYWLFPSKSGGYFHSPDLLEWSFVEAHGYPVEHYAPTALVMNGKVDLTSGDGTTKVYVTDDPASGNWTVAGDMGTGYGDPDRFLDDDGRLYMYDGVSGKDVLRVTELDPKTFQRSAKRGFRRAARRRRADGRRREIGITIPRPTRGLKDRG